MTDKGNIQMNVRLAKTDYLLRVKQKGDNTTRNMIVPLEIPDYITKPDFSYYKEENNDIEKTSETNNKTRKQSEYKQIQSKDTRERKPMATFPKLPTRQKQKQ